MKVETYDYFKRKNIIYRNPQNTEHKMTQIRNCQYLSGEFYQISHFIYA